MSLSPHRISDRSDTPLARAKRELGPLLNVPQINALRGVPLPALTGNAAQAEIAALIRTGGKLVARVGETEGRLTAFHLRQRWGARHPQPYDPALRAQIKFGTGYFPTGDAAIDRLAHLTRSAAQEADLYAAWTPHDRWLMPRGAATCRLIDLEPFFTQLRWTQALAGLRVTVVSPFRTSIEAQYPRRAALFDAPTLPDFALTVVRSMQTNCDADVGGQDWFTNLDALDAAIAATDAQVVIAGAGAYGLPLGARAKARGATAIVLGGATQLLFGIMGNRWLSYRDYRALMNPAWVRPRADERPAGHERLELPGGAHW